MSYNPAERRFDEFLTLIYVERFFEAHEIMENVWIEHGRQRGDLWQGLTQLAVALAHAARGNRAGARRVYRKALAKLPDDVRQADPRIEALLKFARCRLGRGPESDHQTSAGRTDASQ